MPSLSRRVFVKSGLTGLAALAASARMHSPVSAAEYSDKGFNHLIPLYGGEPIYVRAEPFEGEEHIVLIHKEFKSEDGTTLFEWWANKDRYAVSIDTGDEKTSYIVLDINGDGIFRKKCAWREVFERPPMWVLLKYVPDHEKKLVVKKSLKRVTLFQE